MRLGNGNSPRLLCLLENGLRRSDYIVILFDEKIAAREDWRAIFLHLSLVFDVDNRNLQELQARDMRRRQLRILLYNNHTFGIDDRSRKYHPIFKIVHGYCTQGKPSLD